jgi:predicted O-methyltransferase YrrM
MKVDRLRSNPGLRRAVGLAERTAAKIVARVVPRRVMRNKRLFDVWERRGYHVSPVHFYEPIPDLREFDDDFWTRESELVGLEMRAEHQLTLLDELAPLQHELVALDRPEAGGRYTLRNPFYGSVDAEIFYGLLRLRKPRRVYEIGSGHSTLLAAEALRRNEEEGAPPAELVAFEPYPNESLREGFPGLTRLVEKRLQDVPLETFQALEAGDVLFIDSSHVVAPGSDVCRELLEIVPRVQPGVLIHIHDIFMPLEYPERWLREERYFWTEQYLLQAFLAFNSEFSIVWAGAWMNARHPSAIAASVPSYLRGETRPGSFWIVRNG